MAAARTSRPKLNLRSVLRAATRGRTPRDDAVPVAPDARCQALEDRVHELERELAAQMTWVPPGHFYSPIPSPDAVRTREAVIFAQPPDGLDAIDLATEAQLRLLDEFREFYAELPFPDEPDPAFRYYFRNEMYSYGDAVFLYCFLRHLAPRALIEVGSGFSSALILDTNERSLGGSVDLTFIEPYPAILQTLLRPGDAGTATVIQQPVQSVPLETFRALGPNDVLFIDSTHITKTDSDVNYLFFEVLPSLQRGVYVHIHDVFYPFEYPREWILEGRAWNEAYFLRAFLEYNDAFRVVFFTHQIQVTHRGALQEHFPRSLENTAGSIWLQKVSDA